MRSGNVRRRAGHHGVPQPEWPQDPPGELVAAGTAGDLLDQRPSQFPDDTTRLSYLDLPLPGPAIDAATYRTLTWHIAFHSQRQVPEAVVRDDVREYLALFLSQVSFGGTAFGGTSDRSPFTDTEIDEYARTYSRPEALSGGFELYRALDKDVRDTVAAAPVRVPALLMAAKGNSTRSDPQ